MITCSPDVRARVDAALSGTLPSEPIRNNAARLVLRVKPPEGPALYLKKFKERDVVSKLVRLVADRAAKEAKLLNLLRAAGVGAPVVLAWGIHDDMSFLITEEVTGSEVLKEVVEAGLHPVNRKSLMVNLGKFVRAVHDAGVRDDDLHLGNILVRGADLFLIDVHRAVFDTNLSVDERCRGLGFLIHSLHTFFSLPELMRFLHAYWQGRVTKALLLDIVHEFETARERYAESRTARSLLTSNLFVKSENAFLRRPLERPQAMKLLETNPLREVKAVGNRRLWLIDSTRFVRDDPKAQAIWVNSHGLEIRHVSTPRLWARFGNRILGEWLGDALPLDHFIQQHAPKWSVARRREFAFRLARFIRLAHGNGVYHHDLKANNVLCRERAIGWEFFLIDIDRVTFSRRVPLARRLFNLAQLNAALGPPVTLGDRLAFYRAYCGHNRDWHSAWKDRITSVMEKTVARKHRWPKDYQTSLKP